MTQPFNKARSQKCWRLLRCGRVCHITVPTGCRAVLRKKRGEMPRVGPHAPAPRRIMSGAPPSLLSSSSLDWCRAAGLDLVGARRAGAALRAGLALRAMVGNIQNTCLGASAHPLNCYFESPRTYVVFRVIVPGCDSQRTKSIIDNTRALRKPLATVPRPDQRPLPPLRPHSRR